MTSKSSNIAARKMLAFLRIESQTTTKKVAIIKSMAVSKRIMTSKSSNVATWSRLGTSTYIQYSKPHCYIGEQTEKGEKKQGTVRLD